MDRTGADAREDVTMAPDGRPMSMQPAWRRDFPIDWPRDHYVERREFMKFLVLTSLAFVAGQVWIGARDWLRRRIAPPALRIVSIADIPVGGATVFHYPDAGDPCVLVRLTDDRFLAYDQRCTHLSCAVVPRVDRGEFHCPCHHGVFDMQSGRPLAGPPRRPLAQVSLEIRNGSVYATGITRRTV